MKSRRSHKLSRANRAGLTFLEVILSLGIFLGSMTVLLQLLNTGSRAAVGGRLESEAILLCESKLGEVVAGIVEVGNSDGSFDDSVEAGWSWEMTSEETGDGDLLLVTIKVKHTSDDINTDAEFTLTRYMRDPQAYLEVDEEG